MPPRVLRLTMKKPTRYLYVVNPGNLSGTAFFTAYEIENLVDAPDALPESESPAAPVERRNRNWSKAVVRLPKVFHRLVRHNPLRRAFKASAAA